MAGYKTYREKIRKAVKADHNGQIPERLELVIDRYATALEKLDSTNKTIDDDGYSIKEFGSSGQMVTKQHPLYNLSLQLEGICQTYAKMLGLTAAKAAVKTESQGDKKAEDSVEEYLRTIQG
jgi:hypothetical protein